MTGADANSQDTRPAVTTQPLLGVAGLLLSALIATYTGRWTSLGLADIRGALHFGVDEGSWINTPFNASMLGFALMGHYIAVREEFHSNIQPGPAPHLAGLSAIGRAAEVLGPQVRLQADTLVILDSFLLLTTCCVACLVVVSFMSKVPTQCRQVTAAPLEA
jgi:hypothetical protein